MRRRAFLAGFGAIAAAWPVLAQAARKAYRLGFLSHGPAKPARRGLAAALRTLGWREGENIRLEYRVAGSDAARWEAAARALVEKHCDLIVVVGSHMALAAKRATRTIPLVMLASGYPVEAGIVPSLAHPGGNITGMRSYTDELPGKWLELALELVPSLRVLGLFDDYVPPFSNAGESEAAFRIAMRSAHLLKIELRRWRVKNDGDLTRAFADVRNADLDSLWVTSGAIHSQSLSAARIREFVLRRRMPMWCDWPGTLFREGGAVMTYAVDMNEVFERTASFVDRIPKGARPGDLPVEQPTRFQLVLNLRNARAIGMTIPQQLLLRADRVIE
jgi:ABC-type uncharacterized transport system substrate-binding protein